MDETNQEEAITAFARWSESQPLVRAMGNGLSFRRTTRLNRLTNQALSAIVVTLSTVIDLLTVAYMTGVAGQLPVVAIMRIFSQEICERRYMLRRNVALRTQRITELDRLQIATFIYRVVPGQEVNPALDLG